jgi:hypothetical protein
MLRLLTSLGLLSMASAGLNAEAIFYTFTTTVTGTLGTTPFSGDLMTVSSTADTTQVTSTPSMFGPVWVVEPISTTFNIAGVGTGTFTLPTFFDDPNGSGDIIFGIIGPPNGFTGCNGCDGLLGMTIVISALDTYNLQTAIGPLSSPFDFETGAFNTFQNISTSLGNLSLTAQDDTFTAVLPEPASYVLAAAGLTAIMVRRRSRIV